MYEKLNNILKKGLCVPVKNNRGEYLIFSYWKDGNGDFRNSNWHTSLEEAKKEIGSYFSYSKEVIEELSKVDNDNWKILTPFHLPCKPFKRGQEVIIADNVEEECEKWRFDWYDEKKEMIGKKYKIDYVRNGYYNINNGFFPHSALLPVFEEEETINFQNKKISRGQAERWRDELGKKLSKE